MRAKAIEFLDARRKPEAEAIWHAALRLEPLPAEPVAIDACLGRVLAADLVVPADVPPFDRSVVDGYALVAATTFAAQEVEPARLRLRPEAILAGHAPRVEVLPGEAVEIATGGVMPRGANAVQMVERTEVEGDTLLVYRAVVPGANVQAAGSDLRAGEVVFARGTRLSARETGVLAALGLASVECVRRPRVAVLSTGDELRPPGEPLAPGLIHDANSRVLCDALRENGALPSFLGIVPDDEARLEAALVEARAYDAVILSGGTSKGTGDLSFRLIDQLGKPGVLVHGVQLKPGKPVVLGSWEGKPVVVLPGFPASAILTFNLFARPVLRRLAGLVAEEPSAQVEAVVPVRLHSAPGRYEYVLVHLVPRRDGRLSAYPVLKSSGAVSSFAEADGYLEIPESRDMLLAGDVARVTLLSAGLRPADLVFIGSHCQGMDLAFALLRQRHGLTVKVLNVGSTGGVAAVRRGEADLAGIHLLDDAAEYNRAAWRESGPGVAWIRGYGRRQGILYRPDAFPTPPTLAGLAGDPRRRLINRPRGSGTRILLDRLLDDLAPTPEGLAGAGAADADPQAWRRAIPGYDTDARSHGGVAAAVAEGRADWGVAIEAAALARGLGFVALRDEEYDLLVPADRLERPAVQALIAILAGQEFRSKLEALGGFRADPRTGHLLAG